jgi:hypothetical protein
MPKLKFKVGDTLNFTGKIIEVDKDDDDLPYLVKTGENETWVPAESITSSLPDLPAALTPMGIDDLIAALQRFKEMQKPEINEQLKD